jgi:hypothetical protein
MSSPLSVLYVRLPCWKIYPGGVIYVADYVHKQRPEIGQHLLDLALIARSARQRALRERLAALRPDVVAFSWRNMQSFGPHPEDDALDVVMNFDHSGNWWRRLKSAIDAVSILYDYTASRLRNFAYMRLVRKMRPAARIVVGGTAVSIFGKQVAEKCPTDTIIVIGEGEDTMLSIVDGFSQPVGEFYYKDQKGQIEHRERAEAFDLSRLTAVDFPYIESIFPNFGSYLDGDFGINTKRGCPLQCHFCLYNQIEGAAQRYREPREVANEIESLNTRYGVKKFWFTDAQFCSTKKSAQHVEQILDELLARKLDISWSGYLRLNQLTPKLAQKMLATGMASVRSVIHRVAGTDRRIDAGLQARTADGLVQDLQGQRICESEGQAVHAAECARRNAPDAAHDHSENRRTVPTVRPRQRLAVHLFYRHPAEHAGGKTADRRACRASPSSARNRRRSNSPGRVFFARRVALAPIDIKPHAQSRTDGIKQPGLRNRVRKKHQRHADPLRRLQRGLFPITIGGETKDAEKQRADQIRRTRQGEAHRFQRLQFVHGLILVVGGGSAPGNYPATIIARPFGLESALRPVVRQCSPPSHGKRTEPPRPKNCWPESRYLRPRSAIGHAPYPCRPHRDGEMTGNFAAVTRTNFLQSAKNPAKPKVAGAQRRAAGFCRGTSPVPRLS